MSSNSHVESIFDNARRLADPVERHAYLDRTCRDDPKIRARIDLLLSAHADGEFLEHPPAMLATAALTPIGEQPGDTIGHYKLLEQIGEGGMGLVFMAQQSQPLRRRVALKIIKPGLDTRAVIARFEAERQALALMDHPNIARVYDAGATDSGRPYFVMELVRGAPITEYCREHQLPLHQRLELFIEICHAVQHAHQKGVIHRDLKPTNILVAQSDTVAVPKVIDFGVAKATAQPLTERTLFTGFAQIIGTPLYMSPEQADWGNQDIDTRSDVYSLGVILYELLTGATPFDADRLRSANHDEMRRILREEEPPKPSTRATTNAAALSTVTSPGTPPRAIEASALQGDLDWIVMKALEKDRCRRYESASTFASDVKCYLDDQPVEAAPPSWLYRGKKLWQRHQSRAVVGGLVLSTILAASTALFIRRQQQRREERRVTQYVHESLAGVRAAIGSQNVSLAETCIAEANSSLNTSTAVLPALAAEVAQSTAEMEQCRHDQANFARFSTLAQRAQDDMSFSSELKGSTIAEEALGIYGILDREEWEKAVHAASLSDNQKQAVLQNAYVTLVCLADSEIRWDENKPKAKRSLDLLEKAARLRQPTRALYWVRAQAHGLLGNDDAKQRDLDSLKSAPAAFAWDYFLEGHTAGWKGDLDRAREMYRRALQVQPDHFNSLFFLASRSIDANNRAAAIGFYSACVALRPDHVVAHQNRGKHLLLLGDYELAAFDFDKAIEVDPEGQRNVYTHLLRSAAFDRIGKEEIAQKDRQFAIEHLTYANEHSEEVTLRDSLNPVVEVLCIAARHCDNAEQREELWQVGLSLARKYDGMKPEILALLLAELGLERLEQHRWADAATHLREALAIRNRVSRGHWLRFEAMSLLGDALRAQKKFTEAEPLLIDGYQGMADRADQMTEDKKSQIGKAAERLVRLFDDQGRSDEAGRWRVKPRNKLNRSE